MIVSRSLLRPTASRHGGVACVLVLLALLLLGCSSPGGQAALPTPTPLPPQPAVEKPTYTVALGDIVEELQLSGRVSAVKQDDLYFAQAGNVGTIYVRATEAITKGRLLAELDQGDRLTQLKQAELALEQVKLSLQRGQERQKYATQLAQLDLDEANVRLKQAGTAAERELAQIGVQRANVNLEQAQGSTDADLTKQVAQAQLDYDRVKAQVDAGRLYAPYDGMVAEIAIQPGAAVEAYAPVLTVMDPRARELRVENALSTDLARLSAKQEVQIRFSRYPDSVVKGVVERLPQSATSSQSAVKADNAVHISFDPGKLDLDISDLAQVIVTLQHKEKVLWLPPQAVRTFQGRRFVVTESGGKQRRTDVKLGIVGPDRVEIVEGLKEGQVVIGQ